MAEFTSCCPPEDTGEVRDLCRQCLEENCERLLSEVESLESEISIARSDGRIYAGVSKIEQLKDALKDVIPFDTAVKYQTCWCDDASSECLTAACIYARDVLGMRM